MGFSSLPEWDNSKWDNWLDNNNKGISEPESSPDTHPSTDLFIQSILNLPDVDTPPNLPHVTQISDYCTDSPGTGEAVSDVAMLFFSNNIVNELLLDKSSNETNHEISAFGDLTREAEISALAQPFTDLFIQSLLNSPDVDIPLNLPHITQISDNGTDSSDTGGAVSDLAMIHFSNNMFIELIRENNNNESDSRVTTLCKSIDFSFLDEVDEPLLHTAIKNENTPQIHQACKYAADNHLLDATDSTGNTALHWVASSDNVELCKKLLEAGAKINVQNDAGDTPLLVALTTKKYEMAALLLDYAASPTLLANDEISPLMLALEDPHIDKSLFDKLEAADKGFSPEIMNRKLLAHRFGLRGNSKIDNARFRLEAFVPASAVKALSFNVKKYYEILKSNLTTNYAEAFPTLSSNTLEKIQVLKSHELTQILDHTANAIALSSKLSVSEHLENFKNGLPVGITTAWPGHCVTLALYDNRLGRGNRGEGAGSTPGVHIHSIGQLDNLTKALEASDPSKLTENYFSTGIAQDLELFNDVYLSQQFQKVGNCAVANTNSMELGLLYLQLRPLVGHEAAEELARAIKKGRTKDTRIGSVEEYLNFHRYPRTYPPDLELITQLYNKNSSDVDTDRSVRILIEKWAEDVDVKLGVTFVGRKRKKESENPPEETPLKKIRKLE